jgi:hypothetical protein
LTTALQCIKIQKPYTLARFKPGICCSVGGRNDHYVHTYICHAPGHFVPIFCRQSSPNQLPRDLKQCVRQMWLIINIFCGQCLYFSFSTHKQCISSHLCRYTKQHCYVSLKTLYPGGNRTRVYSSSGGCPVLYQKAVLLLKRIACSEQFMSFRETRGRISLLIGWIFIAKKSL